MATETPEPSREQVSGEVSDGGTRMARIWSLAVAWRWWALGALAALGGALLVAGRPTPVAVAPVTRGSAAEIVYATGVVEPEVWSAVAPLLRARIVETCRCEGQTVDKGALLFRLDDAEARARLAEYAARRALAEKQLARAERLLERRVGSQSAFDEAFAALTEAEAALAAQLRRLDDYVVTAPIAGEVLRLDGEIGEVAEPSQPLAWVGRPRPRRIVADVNEEDVPRVAIGQRALVKADAFPGGGLEAEVARITPKGDPVLKTYRVYLALPDETPLYVGMSVEVNVIARRIDGAVLAPAAAVRDGAVFVVENGRARRAPVTLGLVSAERVQLLAGPAPGALLVSPLIGPIEDGARVRIARRAPPPPRVEPAAGAPTAFPADRRAPDQRAPQ